MKKLNNKGVTLVELIVSFALVGVAIIYFFQTLYTVKKVYADARNETNNYINRDYTLRILSTYLDEQGALPDDICSMYNLKCKKAIFDTYYYNGEKSVGDAQKKDNSYGKYYRIEITDENNNIYYLYKHWKILDDTERTSFRPYYPGFEQDGIYGERKNVITAAYKSTARYTFAKKLKGNVTINYSIATDGGGSCTKNTTTFTIDNNHTETVTRENVAGWQGAKVTFDAVPENSHLTVEVSASNPDGCTAYTAINSIKLN
jgi:type II secretory pathway pseudopilin PulG